MDWDKLPDEATIEKTIGALKKRGIEAFAVNTPEEAKKKVLSLLPKGAEVMHMTSATLSELGLAKHIDESGDYDSLGARIKAVDDKEKRDELRRKSLSPDYVIGSAQVVTEDGEVIIVSASGSQIPAYAYGAAHVIWVVGAQKIAKDMETARKRIFEHTLPLESERVREVYKMPNSFVNKLLVFEGEIPGRVTLIIVKHKLGF
jgi:L-lactate utilization protein LutB